MVRTRAIALFVAVSTITFGGCVGTLELDDDATYAGATETNSDSNLVAEESGWVPVVTFEPGGAIAAKFNPVNGNIYYGGRTSNTSLRGLWRIDAAGVRTQIGGTNQVGGVVVDPLTGDVYTSDDFPGRVYRYANALGPRVQWVTGFHAGDDDPVGMAITPQTYTGDVVVPGEILVVDRGQNGLDEIWSFQAGISENEKPVHSDDGTLVDPVDVAISDTDVFVSDQGANQIYRVLAGGTLTPIVMPGPDVRPSSMAIDPVTQDLYVMDIEAGQVIRLDPNTGDFAVVFSGLAVNTDNWGSLDVSADGMRILITERGTASNGTISVFELIPNEPPVAVCQDVTVEFDGTVCTAESADVDGGSFDPDGDPVTITLSDEGPFPTGETEVTLTITDDEGLTDSCTATVSVVQTGDAWFATNALSDPAVHGGNSRHALVLWGFFGGGTTIFDFDDVVVQAASDDSSGRMTGTVIVSEDGIDGSRVGEVWNLDVQFDDAPDTVAPKRELRDPDVNQPPEVTDLWRYLVLAEGSTMTRADGLASAELHQRPEDLTYAFQIGATANGKNLNFGMSGWLFFDHIDADGSDYCGKGDFNLDLEPECAE